MLKLPALPLGKTRLEELRAVVQFFEKPGFFQVYDQHVAEIWHTSSKKAGLKTIAYETTENEYMQFFGCRLFVDRDNFFDEYSKAKRKKRLVF